MQVPVVLVLVQVVLESVQVELEPVQVVLESVQVELVLVPVELEPVVLVWNLRNQPVSVLRLIPRPALIPVLLLVLCP